MLAARTMPEPRNKELQLRLRLRSSALRIDDVLCMLLSSGAVGAVVSTLMSTMASGNMLLPVSVVVVAAATNRY